MTTHEPVQQLDARVPLRLLAGLAAFLVLLFSFTTLPGIRSDHDFHTAYDGWLQGTAYVVLALVAVVRPLTVFGYDDAPHGHMEVALDNVRVPVENILLGEGRGFEIAQGRLGPGRIHHCMRTIGAAERALALMTERLLSRTAFKKKLAEHSVWEQRVADARTNIEMCRLMVLKAAWMIDQAGAKNAKSEIAQIKVAAPRMALQIIDDAIQAFGGAGVSGDTPLAELYATVRTLRIADGPDEVHNRSIALIEYSKHMPA
jgi:alkylation response protein AidB-like acyl-CoA dehydrogenase